MTTGFRIQDSGYGGGSGFAASSENDRRVAATKPLNPDSRIPNPALRGVLRRDADMSRYVSWRAGGRADCLYQPADLDDLALFLCTLPADEPVLAVGLGSNLLVRDGGLRGTVLLMYGALDELRIEGDGAVHAQAGVAGAKLARFAALHNLAGAEFFAGIPGTVGGMLTMNAGCHGSETWDKVERAQVVTRRGEVLERTPKDYEIGYRQVKRISDLGFRISDGAPETDFAKSQIQNPKSPEEFFTGAWFRFAPGDGAEALATIKTLLEKRQASQPLQMPNAGSVFRNPPGDHAGRLIESCGLKGRRIGGAEVSQKHANFIVNAGGATAADIENLINEVRSTVAKQTGIELHPEVRIVGEHK